MDTWWIPAGAVLLGAAILLLAWLPERWRDRSDILAWRNRVGTAGLVLALLGLARGLWPEPAVRIEIQYVFVITLGYGHLIGGAVFSRRRLAALAPPDVPPALFWSFVALSVATLFAAYFTLLDVLGSDFLLFASSLLVISTWHTVENDVALDQAYVQGLKMGRLARTADSQAVTFGISAVLLAMTAASIHPGHPGATEVVVDAARLASSGLQVIGVLAGVFLLLRNGLRASGIVGAALVASSLLLAGLVLDDSTWFASITFGDVFSATTLYHLVQWLVFFADRGRGAVAGASHGSATVMWQRIAWVHAPAAFLCVAVLSLGSDAPSLLYYALFSPWIYVFWSFVHVVQTALVREFGRTDSLSAAHGAVS